MTVAETGTRGLLGATLGSATDREETALALRLLPLCSARACRYCPTGLSVPSGSSLSGWTPARKRIRSGFHAVSR